MKIFTYSWTGTKTGWDYKLTMYGAGETKLSEETLEYVALPAGCLSVKTRPDNGYDAYPVGAHPFDALEIDVNFDCLPEDIAPDFIPLITAPDFEIIEYFAILAGTVFKLDVTFNDGTDSPTTECKFIGMYRLDSELEHDLLIDKGSIVVLDIAKYVCEAALQQTVWIRSYIEFLQANPDSYPGLTAEDVETRVRAGVVEAAWQYGGKAYIVGHTDSKIKWSFNKLRTIHTVIDIIAQQNSKRFLRTDEALSIDFPKPTFHKQTYAGDGTLGAELNYNDLWVITDVDGGDGSVGGLLTDTSESSLFKLYPSSLWDYLNDLCQQFGYKIDRTNPLIIQCAPAFGSMRSTPVDYSPVKLDLQKMRNVKLISSYATLKTAESSLSESLSQGDWSDRDSFEAVNGGTRNDSSVTIPIIYNNLPSCAGYYDNAPRFHTTIDSEQRRNSKPHELGLYYFDSPSFITGQPSEAVRVHEFVKLPLGSDQTTGAMPYSDALPRCGFTAWAPGFDASGQYVGVKDSSQQVWELHNFNMPNARGVPALMANMYLGLFGNSKQMKLSFEVDLDEGVSFVYEEGKYTAFPWWGHMSVFEFDISTLNPYYNNPNKYWYLLKSPIDFAKETVQVELILRTNAWQ